jgi:predicted dinucleotide-binding enzyme
MKIGTIGAGEVALAFAREALAQGLEVVLSSRRGPQALSAKVGELGKGASAATVAEAASLDYVLLAVPWNNVEEALSGLPEWNGRVLIDATNPFAQYSPKLVLADLKGIGASEIVICQRRARRQGVQRDCHGAFQRGARQRQWTSCDFRVGGSRRAEDFREGSHHEDRIRGD